MCIRDRRYTDPYYSNAWTIAPVADRGYAPEIEEEP